MDASDTTRAAGCIVLGLLRSHIIQGFYLYITAVGFQLNFWVKCPEILSPKSANAICPNVHITKKIKTYTRQRLAAHFSKMSAPPMYQSHSRRNSS